MKPFLTDKTCPERIRTPAPPAVFGLPVIGPEHPGAAQLVAAVPDWTRDPDPLVPLYLRRPDARTLAERGLA